MSRKFIVLLTVIVVGQYSLPSKAEEPVDAFLDALQQRGHYDVATQYIDRLSKSSLAPAGFADEADYRKGMLAVRAAQRCAPLEPINMTSL